MTLSPEAEAALIALDRQMREVAVRPTHIICPEGSIGYEIFMEMKRAESAAAARNCRRRARRYSPAFYAHRFGGSHACARKWHRSRMNPKRTTWGRG